MNPFLKKLVDQKFMTEGHANYIEEAVMRKDSFVISGHKGFGILPLMATISTVAKANFRIKQVKGFEDLKEEADYYIIADLSDIDYAKLIADSMLLPKASFIALKDPDHPYSILKLLSDVYKANGDTSKVYQVVECIKVDGEKQLGKITQMKLNDNGKVIKTDFTE
ncbi:MAG: hypothetical protein K0R80_214 [Clostridia bacterium]|nr:hypothetical protein [Clostridia bacterium]